MTRSGECSATGRGRVKVAPATGSTVDYLTAGPFWHILACCLSLHHPLRCVGRPRFLAVSLPIPLASVETESEDELSLVHVLGFLTSLV